MQIDPIPARHQRTRSDHAAETAEDYVEAVADLISETGVCRVTDLARRFGVSHVTVTKIVGRLRREGLVEGERHQPLQLSARGCSLAERARERHTIVVNLLLRLGISPAVAEIDAEGIEHHVSPETLRAFQDFCQRV